MDYIFRSDRLGFRQWKSSDLMPFCRICSDPDVMEFFPNIMTKEQTESSVNRFFNHIETYGHGFFAVDHLESGEFIGFVGYIYQTMNVDFAPCYEIGWRLDKNHWNRGLATEGAKACLDHAFNKEDCSEMYSITPIQNVKSIRIMEKLNMQHCGFFNHPKLDLSSPLLKHVIYKVKRRT